MFARGIRPGAARSSRAASRYLRQPVSRTLTLGRASLATPKLCRSLSTRKTPALVGQSAKLSSLHSPPPPPPPPPDHLPGEYIPDTPIRVLRTAADVHKWRAWVQSQRGDRQQHKGLAFIPTMGALHKGHTTLIRAAAEHGHDDILVSIYVNPAQFGVAEDLDSYPKTWKHDCAVLAALLPELDAIRERAAGSNSTTTTPRTPEPEPKNLVATGHNPPRGGGGGAGGGVAMAVFAPTTAEMYPAGFPGQAPDSQGSFVTITPVGERLEGRTRPTFFRGVATVCMKLFHIARPDRVFLGQKDVQQTVVLRTMVRDFCMPIAVAVVPTVREEGGGGGGGEDGLALSSRNVYLGARRRAVAPVLVRALRAAERVYLEGATAAAEIVPAALKVLLDVLEQQMKLSPGESVMFKMDYISLADPDTMEELEEVDPAKGAILSGAIKMLPVVEVQDGEDLGLNNGPPVRLIDNLILPPRVENKASGAQE